jgi:hypothetical protein
MDWGGVRGRILVPHISVGSVPGSPVAGVLEIRLVRVTLADPLLPTFIYTIYIFVWC